MRILSLTQLTIAKSVVAALAATGLAVAALAQTALPKPPAPGQKIFGYQDAKTGIFHPMLKIEPDLTSSTFTGTYEATFTITLKTAVPTGGSVYCSTELIASSTNDTTFEGLTYIEDAYSVAKVTGTTATCTVITPYSWTLPAASATTTNSLAATYTIGILPASTSTTPVISELDGRSSTAPLGGTTIPATGAITKVTVTATL